MGNPVKVKSSIAQLDESRLSVPFTYGLRPEVLGDFHTLAQSVSALAPTSTPAILIPLVFGLAGNGTWLAYVIATIGIVLVGANINQFASRSTSPGSIYSYVAIGLGPGVGILTGWLFLCGYIVVISSVESQFALYAVPLVKEILHLSIAPTVLVLICATIACYIAWRDIKISSLLMLILEVCSISLISILMGITLWHRGHVLDWSQIKLTGVSAQSLSLGLVFAIFGFTGFESAASLGSEAKDPLKNIPKAIIRSGLWSGTLFIICAYIMILGFSGSAIHFEKCGTPLINLAALDGVPSLGLVLGCGVVISLFACTLACINVTSRLMFMMGHHGLFHSSFSQAHERNRTPHVAIIVATILGTLPALLLYSWNFSLMDIVAWTGTLSAYGFISAYALVSIAAPVYLYQLKTLELRDLLIAILAFSTMCLALVGNVDANAVGVAKYLPYVFITLVTVGIAWYCMLKIFSPETIRSMAADIESIRDRFISNTQSAG